MTPSSITAQQTLHLELQRLVAEQERSALALADRDAILQAAAFAAERFLRSADWEETVGEVLQRLGDATRVDRVYVFEKHAGDAGVPVISQRFEWVAEGVEPQIDSPDLQNVPYRESGLRRWEDVLAENGLIYGPVEDLPDDDRALLEPQGILSLVVVPIFTRSRWWGFVGFDDCHAGRSWSEPEVEALRVAAGTLGAAVQHRDDQALLVEARDQAREASHLKSVFLRNVSHELRTPLNGILGFGQLLADELEGEDREHLDFILDSGHRLLDTLTSLLDFARLESNSYTLSPRRFDPSARLSAAAPAWIERAESAGLEFHLDLDGAPSEVELDAEAFGQVAGHLVSNALKFTRHGSVGVRLAAVEDRLRLEVWDTGIGIREEFLPHLFEDFRQASSGCDRSHEGTGLGLAISHHLVRRMGGSIGVESRPAEGSTFTVSLPCRPAAGSRDGGGVGSEGIVGRG